MPSWHLKARALGGVIGRGGSAIKADGGHGRNQRRKLRVFVQIPASASAGAVWVVERGAVGARRVQSGYLTSYALIMLLGLVAAVTWVLM